MTAPGLPFGDDKAARFEEPWQARAFGIVNLLVQQGVLAAADWSACLGAKRNVESSVDHGYWRDWLETVEDLLRSGGVLTASHVEAAIHAISEAREHRHAAAPEPLVVDPAQESRA